MKLFLFFSTVLALLFGMHYAFFRSLMVFFRISNPALRSFFNILTILLSLSFITFFLALYQWSSGWAVWPYRLSGIWMGFLLHFLSAILLLWGMSGVARVLGRPFQKKPVAAVLLLVTAGYSVFGVWSSFYPIVREQEVAIMELPRSWHGRTIVQLSDIHLGHIYGQAFAERLVKRVNSLNPDLIVITGDLFDGVDGAYDIFVDQLNRLEAGFGVLFVTGNHEHYVGLSEVREILRKTELRFLDNEMVEFDGLQVVGVSYPGIRGLDEIANLFDRPESDSARLLLFHTPTNILKNSEDMAERHMTTYWMPDTSFSLNKALNVDLQLSGHTHHGQIFPFNFVTGFLFQGYDYGLKSHGDLQVYTTSGTGSWGPPMRSPFRSEIVVIRLVPDDGTAGKNRGGV